jgi:hypothetical protein
MPFTIKYYINQSEKEKLHGTRNQGDSRNPYYGNQVF